MQTRFQNWVDDGRIFFPPLHAEKENAGTLKLETREEKKEPQYFFSDARAGEKEASFFERAE